MRAFISRTFRLSESEQCEAADYFVELARKVGLEPVWVKPEADRMVVEHVLRELDGCDIAIGVFTKRHKIDGRDAWTVPPSIVYEMAVASTSGRRLAAFLQKGVDREELGLLDLAGWQIPDFDPSTMRQKKERERFLHYLKGLTKETAAQRSTYKMVRYEKTVEVFPNEYGIVTHRCRLLVQDRAFKQVVHYFSLHDNARRDVFLPSFDELSSTPVNFWDGKTFFAFRVLDPKSADANNLAIGVESTPKSDNEQIEFAVKLSNQPKLGLVINYEWAVGCPGLFPTTKANLGHGLRKTDSRCCTSTVALGHGGIDDFRYCLKFYGSPNFEQPPTLRLYDSANNPRVVGGSFDLTKGVLGYTFMSSSLNLSHLSSGTVTVEWTPE